MWENGVVVSWTFGLACSGPAVRDCDDMVCDTTESDAALSEQFRRGGVVLSAAEMKLSVLEVLTNNPDLDAEDIGDMIDEAAYDVAVCLGELEAAGLVYPV